MSRFFKAEISLHKLYFLLTLSIFLSTNVYSGNKFHTKSIKQSYKNKNLTIRVHYPEERLAAANHVESIIKTDLPKIHKYFDYISRSSVDIVIDQNSNTANGSATVFPKNQILLYDYPPTHFDSLSHSEDWMRILVVHEYLHILSLEMTFGFLNFLRFFAGSTMKWNGLMPGWLAEGIAVWGESFFTGEGRIYHPLIKAQLKQVLLKKNTCKKISCLDAPKHYPYRGFRYWIGGFFLNYLEKNKPGFVKCMTRNQARRIPMFLSGSWDNCYGKSLNESYDEFVKNLVSDSSVDEKKCYLKKPKNCELVSKRFKAINWFKGFVDSSKVASFVTQENPNSRIYGKEGEKLILINKSNKKLKKIFLNRVIEKIYKDINHDDSFFVSAWEKQKRIHYHFKIQNKKVIKKVYRPEMNCDEILEIKGDGFTCKVYEKSHWVVKKSKKKSKNKENSFEFPYLKKVEVLDYSEDKIQVAKENFYSSQKFDLESGKSLDNKLDKAKDSKYRGLKYMTPGYLLFNVLFGNNLSLYGIETSASDPLNRHNLFLSLYYNGGLSGIDLPLSGGASYFYNKAGWSIGGGYGKSFGLSLGKANIYEGKDFSISKSYLLGNINSATTLQFSRINQFDNIVGVNRNIKDFGLSQSFSHSSSKISSFYRGLSLRTSFNQVYNRSFDPYQSLFFNSTFRFNFSDTWKNFLTGSFQKLFKKAGAQRFRDGVIYAGGINSFFTGNFRFPSYHALFQQVFGDDLKQVRFETSKEVLKLFYSTNFLYSQLRTVELFLGSEYLKTDIALLGINNQNQFVFGSNPEVISFYGGARLKLDLLFLLPLQIDVYASYTGSRFFEGTTSGVLFSTYRSF